MDRKRLTGGWLLVLALAGTASAQAPTPAPSPTPNVTQDELDLQGRANFGQGAGARAYGMGGAFLARADDATAASWNPAGLSYLRLPEASAVWAHSRLSVRERPLPAGEPVFDQTRGNTPDFFAGTYPIQIRGASGSAQLSFQRVISFRSDRTIQRFSPRTVNSGGGFDVLALGTGLQITHGLRMGVTVNRWFNGYTQHIETTVESATRPGSRIQDNAFDLSGWNFNLGVIWSPNEKLNLGAVGKTPFSGKVTLRRERLDIINTAEGPFRTANDYSADDLVLEFPGSLGLGVSVRPASPLTISADYTRTFWSKGRIRNFFTLPKEKSPVETGQDFFPALPYPTLNDPVQQDTEQIRFGIEYVVLRGRIKWPIRAGYFNDRQYFRDLFLAAPRFGGWTAGTGLILGRVLLDVAYLYEAGTYKDPEQVQVRIRSHRVFASLIYRHPRH